MNNQIQTVPKNKESCISALDGLAGEKGAELSPDSPAKA
jgi:hypothetical protein